MSTPPSDLYLDPYRDAHENHGCDFGVTLWASPRSQAQRFDVFTQMCFLHGKRVLDAGCSRGDFAAFLLKKGIQYERYIGIDGLEEVIQYARHRNLPRAEFHAGDFLSDPGLLQRAQPQVVALSGTLNTMEEQDAFQTLQAAWDAAGQTLLFNFLSDRCGQDAPPQMYPARRLDTMQLLQWAFDRTWAVQFRQDYFKNGHDATIMMKKR